LPLGNASKCPTYGATLEISLGSKTVATLDRGALNVLSTRIARQGRNVHLTLVVLLLLRIKSAIMTGSVLDPIPRNAPTTNVSAVHVVMTGTVLEGRNVRATDACRVHLEFGTAKSNFVPISNFV